jgi:hypothetical protein
MWLDDARALSEARLEEKGRGALAIDGTKCLACVRFSVGRVYLLGFHPLGRAPATCPSRHRNPVEIAPRRLSSKSINRWGEGGKNIVLLNHLSPGQGEQIAIGLKS